MTDLVKELRPAGAALRDLGKGTNPNLRSYATAALLEADKLNSRAVPNRSRFHGDWERFLVP